MKWIARIVGGIVGLFAIVFGLAMIFGETMLPACDQAETKDVMGTIVADRALMLPIPKVPKEEITKALEIDDIAEASFDEAKQERTCTATLSLKVKDSPVYDKLKVGYTITWIDRKKSTFQVSLKAE
jgi:hypothetical protein